MNAPKVSVVMSVYNGAKTLEKTIHSVLSQSMADFEFIIVNDGSSDQSSQILQNASNNDSRIVILEQDNQGLTQSLINGCQIARGHYIARQDDGDISFKTRLASQLQCFENIPRSALVSCGTEFIAPTGETLYTVTQSHKAADQGLRGLTVDTLRGPPHHGSAMFRRDLYLKVGGYRAEFEVAQDIDLWSRLIEHGMHQSLGEVLYQAVIAKNSISMLRRDQQLAATQAIIDCSQARQHAGNDQKELDYYTAKNRVGKVASKASNISDADFYYFIASNLSKTNLDASTRYLRLALKSNPYHWKAYAKLVMNFVAKTFEVKVTQ